MKYIFKMPRDIGQFDVKAAEGEWKSSIKNVEEIKEILDKNKIDVSKEDWDKYVDDDSQKFFNKMSFIVTMIIVCPPIGLIFMYAYGKNSKLSKVLISIIVMTINIIVLCIIVYYLKKVFR